MVDEETVRKKLKALRDYYGMSTKTMAERVGMESKWLQNYFRGERGLAADELVDIMVAFGIGPTFFLTKEQRAEVAEHRRAVAEDLGLMP